VFSGAWATVVSRLKNASLVSSSQPTMWLDIHSETFRSAVVISGGFSERDDPERRALEDRLGLAARAWGIRVCGPNCTGVGNVRDGIWTSAAAVPTGKIRSGGIALISQSGSVGFSTLFPRAVAAGVGLSYLIITGNQADLEFSDYVRFLIDDPGTSVIAGYVEGFKDAEKFKEVAALAAYRGTPIVLVKVGRDEQGAVAARSHTGALTGADSAYDALFRQYGVIRVDDYDELLETANLLAEVPRPHRHGLTLVSHSGGVGTLAADLLGQEGFALPELTQSASDGIRSVIGDFGWVSNPADVTRFALEPESFSTILGHLVAEPDVGAFIVASQAPDEQSATVLRHRESSGRAAIYLWTGASPDPGSPGVELLKDGRVPIFLSPGRLAVALRRAWGYAEWRTRWLVRDRVETQNSVSDSQALALEEMRALGR
jgi:acetyltransferase